MSRNVASSDSFFTPEEWEAVLWSLAVGERETRDDLDLGWTPSLGKRNNAIVSAMRKIRETRDG